MVGLMIMPMPAARTRWVAVWTWNGTPWASAGSFDTEQEAEVFARVLKESALERGRRR